MSGTTRRHILWGKCVAVLLASQMLIGCSDPAYDTSTPERTLDAMEKMVADGRADLLPTLIELEAREVTFDDGVTEASAIGDVKSKLGDMLGRLWRVSLKLKERWPEQVAKEAAAAEKLISAQTSERRDVGEWLSQIMTDPFMYFTTQRDRLKAEDLTDGTASVTWDDEPLWQAVSMIETDGGWRFTVPVAIVQGSEYWPQTRPEWAVIAYVMLAIENSLKDFEDELDSGKFRDLRHASERVGRLVAESVVAQGIIYAMMKRNPDVKPTAPQAP
ncbi:MAG: hypothetical protein SGJ11_05665 [Phycisphaerae bacterium]|nr:hypothetical protein [Phycisphaerae bacterium]